LNIAIAGRDTVLLDGWKQEPSARRVNFAQEDVTPLTCTWGVIAEQELDTTAEFLAGGVVKIHVEVVSRSHTPRSIDPDASEWSEASRITRTSGVNVSGSFVLKSCLFVVGPFSGGCDEVLEGS
jgi:hypothetical protein